MVYHVLPNYVFGPVPSRRLGKSLGVNNIPAKICSYNCVYCQLGRTIVCIADRRSFYKSMDIFRSVERRVKELEARGERIDYITFVPDGEPTLDKNLGETAGLVKNLGYPIAILTNSSLLYREDVKEELSVFDYVSLKLDAVTEDVWRIINRPHESLRLDEILDGMLEFRRHYRGKLVTETMLIDGIDYNKELERIAYFLKRLEPDIAYVAVPTRPPAEEWVKPAPETIVNKAYQLFKNMVKNVELLIGFEGTSFTSTGDPVKDLLSITSVHPMREDAIEELLEKTGANWDIVEELIAQGKLVKLEYQGKRYYMRKIPSRR